MKVIQSSSQQATALRRVAELNNPHVRDAIIEKCEANVYTLLP